MAESWYAPSAAGGAVTARNLRVAHRAHHPSAGRVDAGAGRVGLLTAVPSEPNPGRCYALRSRRGSATGEVVFALGILLSSASQLRAGRSSIGPGEICLVLWLLLMTGREVFRLGPPLTPALSRLLIFWILFAIALSIGTMAGYALHDKHDPVWFLHDAMAYPFSAALSCLSVVQPGAGRRLRRVAWLLVAMGAGCLALQLAKGGGLIGFPSSDHPWYWDRFRGWSANPAQLAFLCAALALLALHLAETATRTGARLAAILCMVVPIYVGWLTKTATFTIAVVLTGPIFVALKLRIWLVPSRQGLTFRYAAACIVLIAFLPLLAAGIPLAASISGAKSTVLTKAMSKGNSAGLKDEADLRFRLWARAWRRGVKSAMLGLGPGPHLPIPASIVTGRMTEGQQPANLEHPAVNGTPNFEAHNTVLDLFTQGGLLAVSSLLWLVGTALVNTYKAGLAGLTALLAGVLIFSGFDLIARYPIFWWIIALCLVAGLDARRSRGTATYRS